MNEVTSSSLHRLHVQKNRTCLQPSPPKLNLRPEVASNTLPLDHATFLCKFPILPGRNFCSLQHCRPPQRGGPKPLGAYPCGNLVITDIRLSHLLLRVIFNFRMWHHRYNICLYDTLWWEYCFLIGRFIKIYGVIKDTNKKPAVKAHYIWWWT